MDSPTISLALLSIQAKQQPRLILDLPVEIILLIFSFLDRLQDLFYLLLSNKHFQEIYSHSKTKYPPLFPGYDDLRWTFPFPHLLLIPIARQLNIWARQSKENCSRFRGAMKFGYDGLIELANEVTKITLDDIRDLYKTRHSLIGPLAGAIVMDFRKYNYSEQLPQAMLLDPVKTLVDCWIYYEFFVQMDPIDGIVLYSDAQARMQFMINCVENFYSLGSNFISQRSLCLTDLRALSNWNAFCDQCEKESSETLDWCKNAVCCGRDAPHNLQIPWCFKDENQKALASSKENDLFCRTASWLQPKSFRPIVQGHGLLRPLYIDCPCFVCKVMGDLVSKSMTQTEAATARSCKVSVWEMIFMDLMSAIQAWPELSEAGWPSP